MTRRISFISIVGAALVFAAPALGGVPERFVEGPQWQVALEARSEALNKKHGLGDYSNVSTNGIVPGRGLTESLAARQGQVDASSTVAGRTQVFENMEQAVAGSTQSQLDPSSTVEGRIQVFGTMEQAVADSALDIRERSFAAKHEAQLAATREATPIVVDDRFRIDPTANPVPVEVTNGREIEWPDVGVGLGIGLLLGLCLLLAVRYTRTRPLAH